MESVSPHDRAHALLRTYATYVGVSLSIDTTLDDRGARSFGNYDFQLNAATSQLRVRVFVSPVDENLPHAADGIRKVTAALNDPRIGGMYDRAGGFFTLDPVLKTIFLTRDIDLRSVSDKQWIQDVEQLRIVDARWFHSWFRHVDAQAPSKEPPPAQHITLQHDTYVAE